jgi:predicted amidophosphoribosyltransferase
MSDEELQEHYQGDKECPECGAPVENVRMTCPKCGHEYKDEDYTDDEAGSEFRAGSALDESGEEKEGVIGDADADAARGK